MHEMKLKEEFYNYILNGTKKIEIRLFDEKRSQIKLNDKIKFIKEENPSESFIVNVTGLLRYTNFDEMFENFDIKDLACETYTKEKLKSRLEEFYTKEKQETYGVLGIKIKKNY